jgi:DNA-directed RNA polymerase sigma subunit (sigma70/sigma32)
VGEQFGISRERVRQLQDGALKKLRKMIEKMEST